MNKSYGRLTLRVKAVAKAPLGELVELFGNWVRIPESFGAPNRQRLFSPPAHLLAVSLASLGHRRLLPRGRAQVSSVVGAGGTPERLPQDRRLL